MRRCRTISSAWIRMSSDCPCIPPCGWCSRTRACAQGMTLAGRTRGEQDRRRAGGLPDAPRRHVGPHRLHRVVDREQRRHVAARRVDVQRRYRPPGSPPRGRAAARRPGSPARRSSRRRGIRRGRAAAGSRCRTSARRARPARRRLGSAGRHRCSFPVGGGTMATYRLPTQRPYRRSDLSATDQLPRRSRMGVEVHEQTIEAPPADVWGFMVDPAALSAWFGADAWLEPVARRVGAVPVRRRVGATRPRRTGRALPQA